MSSWAGGVAKAAVPTTASPHICFIETVFPTRGKNIWYNVLRSSPLTRFRAQTSEPDSQGQIPASPLPCSTDPSMFIASVPSSIKWASRNYWEGLVNELTQSI